MRISIGQSKLLGKWLLAFGILTSAACSAPPQPNFDPPSGAVPLTERGAFDVLVSTSEVHFLLLMPESMRRSLDEGERWRLPRSLSWAQLRDHFAAQLGGGWSIDKHFPEQGSTYRRAVWRYDGRIWWWDERPVYAISYVDFPASNGFAVLTTFRPKAKR